MDSLTAVLLAFLLSKHELLFQDVHEQRLTTSCGYSSAATLLDMYWGIPVTEERLLSNHFGGTREGGEYSVALSDIQLAVTGNGIACRAYRMNYTDLLRNLRGGYAPVLVHFRSPQQHFLLVLDATDDFVTIADPATGLRFLDAREFSQRWSGYALLAASGAYQKNTERLAAAVARVAARRIRIERMVW